MDIEREYRETERLFCAGRISARERIERLRELDEAELAAEPRPGLNDAQGWDNWRTRRGIAGCHH